MRVLFISTNRYRYMPAMPLGLASIIAQLDERRHQVRLLDLMFSEDPEAETRRVLAEFEPQVVGISIRNLDNQRRLNNEDFVPEAARIVTLCRSHSDAIILLGGAAFSTCPEAIFSFLRPDFGIAGEGERVVPALLERLELRRDPTNLPGLLWQDKTGIFMNPCVHNHDPDALKPPRHDLVDHQRYVAEGGIGNLIVKLGCAFNCLYCDDPATQGRQWRMRSPERVADELEILEKDLGLGMTFFTDAVFNTPVDHAKAVCRELMRRKLTIRWICLANPINADEELLALMRDAGCATVVLSCDSGSDRMLHVLNKGFSKADTIRATDIMERLGLAYSLCFLLGAPGEDKRSVEETLGFLDDRRPTDASLNVGIRILPNTSLRDMAVAEGVIAADDTLMEPRFYLSPGVEGWIEARLEAYCDQRPHCRLNL